MPHIRIDLDQETYSALMHKADEERRPLQWQAEVLLRRALGLQFPYPPIVDIQTENIRKEIVSAR